MLCIENACLGYHNHRSRKNEQDIIKSMNFNIPDGEFLAVIGPNGSGKSTLLRALAGAMVPRAGQILLNNRPVHKYAPRVLARTLAFLPQGPSAPEDYTVRDLVGYGRFPHLGWSGRMTIKDKKIVDQAVERTHLEALADRTVASLSGGERQRSWIAMALAQQARILILDEPTTFLDICFQLETLELIKNLNQTLGITTIIVLHDLNQAARFARTILAIHQGRVAVAGHPDQVFEKNTLEKIFHISAGIRQDPHNHCPYLIPISSTKTASLKKES